MYDAFSSDYDRFVNWPERLRMELPFILELLAPLGGQARVLDAACGTGMHALALAQQGYRVVGTDLSSGMIERARANAVEAGGQVEFVVACFGELAPVLRSEVLLDPPFDAVLCLGNSLPHLLSPEDLEAALLDFSACLRPGGQLLIQSRNFDAVMAQHLRWMEPQSYLEGQSEWIFVRFYDFEAQGLITFNIITLHREGRGDWAQNLVTTQLRPLLHAELTGALAQAGFQGLTSHGNMAGAAFDPVTSGNLVLTGRKHY